MKGERVTPTPPDLGSRFARMSHHFWSPLSALTRVPGGWLMERPEGLLGAILPSEDGRFEVWVKRGEQAEFQGRVSTLALAAIRLWDATHVVRWRDVR